jgi:hypothetical protein
LPLVPRFGVCCLGFAITTLSKQVIALTVNPIS